MSRRKARVSRALGGGCRPALIEALASRSPRTITDLASELKLSYMGVKSQCLALQRTGHLSIARRRSPRGRPEVLYSLSSKGRELLPDAGSTFSLAVLDHAGHLFGTQAPAKLLYRFFVEAGNRYAQKLDGLSPRQRLQRLIELRANEGHFMRFEDGPRPSLVESHNPLGRLTAAHPDSLAYETDALARALALHLRREPRPGGETAFLILDPLPEDPPTPARNIRKSGFSETAELPLFESAS